jgi:hypothetical protein
LLLTTEMSHTAWDRDGALIVETLLLNEAIEMIRAFDKLKAWENVLAQLRAPLPIGASLPIAQATEAGTDLADLLKAVGRARVNLHALAYPNP